MVAHTLLAGHSPESRAIALEEFQRLRPHGGDLGEWVPIQKPVLHAGRSHYRWEVCKLEIGAESYVLLPSYAMIFQWN